MELKKILTVSEALAYGPLSLAYLGDAVYELKVREKLVSEGDRPSGKLNDLARRLVSAKGQSEGFSAVEGLLTEEEKGVFRRGRNADSTPHKNNDIGEYKKATGLESLFGFLYLTGQNDRLDELSEVILQSLSSK